MDEIDRLLNAISTWRGQRLALATVISTWGSAPRPRGSHMLVAEDGRFEGSVSGGCVEGDVLQTAAEVISDGKARSREYGVGDDAAWQVGLPCGGNIVVLVQPVSDDGFPPDLFDQVAAARRVGKAFTVGTDLSSGHSSADAAGSGFVNIYRPARRALIVGAVQIAQSLAQLALTIGVVPVVIDPRGRFLTSERFPDVELDDRWPDEAIAARIPGEGTAIITLSHDPKIDDPALEAALRASTGYIAALGSRRSHAARIDRLRESGFAESDIARIDGPAGLDIGAVGPAEIALSIASGMIAAFNQRD